MDRQLEWTRKEERTEGVGKRKKRKDRLRRTDRPDNHDE